MKLLEYIVGRLCVAKVVFRGPEDWDIEFFTAVRSLSGVRLEACGDGSPVAGPAAAVLSGRGVVTRRSAEAADIVAKVTGEPDTFLWTYFGNDISFVRRSQAQAVTARLENEGLTVIACGCCDAAGDSVTEAVRSFAEEAFGAAGTLRSLLRPDRAGCALACAAVRRIRFPLLAAALLVLAVNTLVFNKLEKKAAAQHRELVQRRQTAGRQADLSDARRKLEAELSAGMQRGYGLLCDRIGSAVPGRVRLTELAVQPLLRPASPPDLPGVAVGEVRISGTASEPRRVSDFVGRLQSALPGCSVELSSVGATREGCSEFMITLGL